MAQPPTQAPLHFTPEEWKFRFGDALTMLCADTSMTTEQVTEVLSHVVFTAERLETAIARGKKKSSLLDLADTGTLDRKFEAPNVHPRKPTPNPSPKAVTSDKASKDRTAPAPAKPAPSRSGGKAPAAPAAKSGGDKKPRP